MVRSLIALLLLPVGLSAGACAPYGTLIERPEPKEEILHVSTAYAFTPDKVEQGPFDKRAAREALARIDVTKCGATKDGHAKVTFATDGTVSKVDVDWPNDLTAATVECIRNEFAKARILAFDGQPVTLGTSWRASR